MLPCARGCITFIQILNAASLSNPAEVESIGPPPMIPLYKKIPWKDK